MPGDLPGDFVVAISLATGRAVKAWPGRRFQSFNPSKVRQFVILGAKDKTDAIRRAEAAHAAGPAEDERTDPMAVRCDFCGRWEDTVEAAADAGWIPSYFLADAGEPGEEVPDPVCPECVARYLVAEPETEEFTARPGLEPPRLNQRSRDRIASPYGPPSSPEGPPSPGGPGDEGPVTPSA